jgi:hypothetical protein
VSVDYHHHQWNLLKMSIFYSLDEVHPFECCIKMCLYITQSQAKDSQISLHNNFDKTCLRFWGFVNQVCNIIKCKFRWGVKTYETFLICTNSHKGKFTKLWGFIGYTKCVIYILKLYLDLPFFTCYTRKIEMLLPMLVDFYFFKVLNSVLFFFFPCTV